MNKISYSTPLSLCLSGEYGTQYQKPLLVVAVEPRIVFSIWESTRNKIQPKKYESISQMARSHLEKQKIHFSERPFEYDLHVDSVIAKSFDQLSLFMAETVAAFAAFLEFYSGKTFGKEVINSLAFEAEKKHFRWAFGFAGSASSYGGMIYYRKEFEFLKYVSNLSFRIPKIIEQSAYLIVDQGVNISFDEMTEKVGDCFNKEPKKTEQILLKIERITRRMVVSLIKEDASLFSDCILENEELLEKLGVVPQKSTKLLQALIPYGIGKISSSKLILFYSEKGTELEKFLIKNNIDFMPLKQDFIGLKKLD